MKKRFISKKKKHRRFKLKFLLFVFLFITALCYTFKFLLKSNIKINDKEFVEYLLNQQNHEYNAIGEILSNIDQKYSPVNLLTTNYYELVNMSTNQKKEEKKKVNNDYQIYIYNSHQKEEYQASSFVEGEVKPTVMMSSYIMQDVFNKNHLQTIVEERSISDLLSSNHWKYYKSYDASRIYLEDIKKQYPTIKYFIDVHRDSLKRDKTTVTINEKSFAKMIFLIGTENPNYQQNLDFVTRINNRLNEKYPNLSKGIYQKGGAGVNGVYNQDNSPHTILVEIGGVENTTMEVLNSTLAFTECFMEVIMANEG